MAYEQILYDVSERIATLTLNRPDRLNAWTPVMESEVFEALKQADCDPGVRVIILTGAGRGFCAGADLQSLDAVSTGGDVLTQLKAQLAAGPGELSQPDVRADFRKTYSYFPAISKPIIGALNGPTVGLGFAISLYCDLRFASDQAKFSTAFSRRGLIAEHGISWMLPRLIGMANALDLLYSARLIDSAEALRMGLISRVMPQSEFLAEVRSYARELADKVSPRSLRVMKRQVYEAQFQTLEVAIDVANEEMLKSFQCDDFKEGVAHFVNKRPPNFTGN
ncbi:enoyl-CoA hydratase [Schlesneria paludicola]|uniref:enoyl-CoA hydratase n=1 Tax=Schlesneria paludicola TaxID=360056 RepID=UPI000299E0F9|nr:enoyl-CoA hydratase [Schlesneria paludicola]